MAGTGGKSEPDLIQELCEHPERFEFFQAVRLIEQAAILEDRAGAAQRVGGRGGPVGESLSFRTLQSLSVPSGQISGITAQTPSGNTAGEPSRKFEMLVSFFGLTGPGGALPEHYTSMIIERTHLRKKDFALRDFLDLFNHRMISMFFRAWEKYRFPFAYERQLLEGTPERDLFTHCLYSVVGLGSAFLRERNHFDDQMILYYGGVFAAFPRNVVSLQQVLADYFQLQATVEQFVGQWLYLPTESQSAMPSARRRNGQNLELGASTVAGSRVWDVCSRIRVCLGALSWQQFQRLLPGTPGMHEVSELIRLYVGPDLDFDVQLILKRRDVPRCRLAAAGEFRPMLGWNTWMGNDAEQTADASEAVFRY